MFNTKAGSVQLGERVAIHPAPHVLVLDLKRLYLALVAILTLPAGLGTIGVARLESLTTFALAGVALTEMAEPAGAAALGAAVEVLGGLVARGWRRQRARLIGLAAVAQQIV